MRQSIITLFVIASIASCTPTKDDVSGAQNMAGKIYLVNPYDSIPAKVQPAQKILLQRTTDVTPASYMFSAITGTSGEFAFNYLYAGQAYKLYAETRHNTRWDNDVLFTLDTTGNPAKNISLFLRPDTTQQNGLFIICEDTVTVGTPGVIPGVSIFIYTSGVLAAEDSAQIAGEGASFHFAANMEGKALKMNLPADRPVYINSTCTYGGKKYMSKYDRKQLRTNGIDTLRIRLKS